MKNRIIISSLLALMAVPSVSAQGQCPAFLDVTARKLHSEKQVDLCKLTEGKPVLIVNTASNCGYTSQFKGLESLHKTYKDQGLVVLGFPSNDFNQEEAEEVKTADVCYINYGVTFTMLAPGKVKGQGAQSVFNHLSAQTSEPNWNFNKYLVSADGKVVQKFNSSVKPDSDALVEAIEQQL
ncbi:glutathione peroxidase [Shewanella sp. Scap07]|uniref:glutathione peroxidase n=1 Tax=Shewanella sp. Scap07 TaxID=2589987 RepID=UPI0015BCA2C5|nr:glutathione peroxidase [Shewanella sp. Scap07]